MGEISPAALETSTFSEPKVKVMIPMYEPLETSKCEKCGKIIAEPKDILQLAKKLNQDLI